MGGHEGSGDKITHAQDCNYNPGGRLELLP